MNAAFVAVRHGQAEPSGRLDASGKRQMELFAKSFVAAAGKYLVELRPTVISSTALRAVESAQILSQALGIPGGRIVCDGRFWGDATRRADIAGAERFLDHVLAEGQLVFLVGHLDVLTRLLVYAAGRLQAFCSLDMLRYGEGALISRECFVHLPTH